MPPRKNEKRTEAASVRGKVWILLPLPHRDRHENLIGYRWVRTDIIELLQLLPNYDPFLEANADDGYYFDTAHCTDLIIPWIIENCIYPEGRDAGKPFIPERWQWAVYLNMYGWFSKKTNYRRYQEVFIYVPRKNGKTTAFGAVPALVALYIGRENRAQHYCCAADTEQAALNFRHAAYMVEHNPEMLNRLKGNKVRHGTKFMEHNDGSSLKVLSSIAETKHGTSPCYVGIDEVHAHKTSDLIDTMITGMGARDEPQAVYTTTADFDRPSVCNDLYARAKAVCEGRQSDPTLLPVIYEASKDDPWDSESTWRKANPNYGISIRETFLRKEARIARSNPKLQGRFQRLYLNIRTAVETAWIYPSTWSACNPVIDPAKLLSTEQIMDWMKERKFWFSCAREQDFTTNNLYYNSISAYREWYSWLIPQFESLREEICYAAYDNSSVKDIASLSLFFPDKQINLPWFWVPAESIHERSANDGIPYSQWYAAGLIQNTPLTTIHEPDILTTMLGPAEDWEAGLLHQFPCLRMVAFDRWSANFIAGAVSQNGIKITKYSQGFQGMNEPCKKVVSWLEQKTFQHGANPVLKWMIGNCMAEEHPSGMIRPSRKSSSDKIDGIVSMCMAIGTSIFGDTTEIIKDLPGLMEPNNEPESDDMVPTTGFST